MPLTLVPTPAPWSLHIFEVNDRAQQRHVLRAVSVRDRPGVLALGAESDAGTFVIVDSPSAAIGRQVEADVQAMAPTARCTYRSARHAPLDGPW